MTPDSPLRPVFHHAWTLQASVSESTRPCEFTVKVLVTWDREAAGAGVVKNRAKATQGSAYPLFPSSICHAFLSDILTFSGQNLDMMFSKTHPSCPRFLYHPTSSLVLALEFIPTNYHLYIPNSMKHHLFNLMAAPRGLPGHNVGLNPQPGKGHVGRPRDAPADGEAIWLEELHVLGEAVPASQLRVHRSNAQLHIVGPGCHSHPKGHGWLVVFGESYTTSQPSGAEQQWHPPGSWRAPLRCLGQTRIMVYPSCILFRGPKGAQWMMPYEWI